MGVPQPLLASSRRFSPCHLILSRPCCRSRNRTQLLESCSTRVSLIVRQRSWLRVVHCASMLVSLHSMSVLPLTRCSHSLRKTSSKAIGRMWGSETSHATLIRFLHFGFL